MFLEQDKRLHGTSRFSISMGSKLFQLAWAGLPMEATEQCEQSMALGLRDARRGRAPQGTQQVSPNKEWLQILHCLVVTKLPCPQHRLVQWISKGNNQHSNKRVCWAVLCFIILL